MTRAFVQLGHGHLLEAVALNPLAPAVFLWVLLRLVDLLLFNLFGRNLDLGLPRAMEWRLWFGFFALFFALSGWRLAWALYASAQGLGAP